MKYVCHSYTSLEYKWEMTTADRQQAANVQLEFGFMNVWSRMNVDEQCRETKTGMTNEQQEDARGSNTS